MELIEGLVKVLELTPEQQDRLVRAFIGLCKEPNPPYEHFFLQMKEGIESDADKAKEYFKTTQPDIPAWLYTSINWSQVYKKLCQEGLLISSPAGTLMKLKASKY